jgi:alkyl hydroperoxide reductase, subunit F
LKVLYKSEGGKMALLDSNIVKQLKGYFDKINGNIELVSFLNDSDKSKELDSFLQEVDAISEKVNYVKKTFENDKTDLEKANITRPTSFTILKDGENTGINFSGIPGGHEFNSFILAILGLAGFGKKLEGEQLSKVESINKPVNIETFVSLSCTHCPDVVQALNLISTNNKNITITMIDSAVFFEEAKEKDIQAVPVVFINREQKSVGAKTIEELINLVTNA